MQTPNPNDEGSKPTPAFAGLFDEIAQLGSAIKRVFGAQWHLFVAELGLARSALSWLLIAGLLATIFGVGLGFTLLGLIGVLLARWFHSWAWSLAALSVLQIVFLVLTVLLFRRCMHWLSLPASRSHLRAMTHETVARAKREISADKPASTEIDPP